MIRLTTCLRNRKIYKLSLDYEELFNILKFYYELSIEYQYTGQPFEKVGKTGDGCNNLAFVVYNSVVNKTSDDLKN